MAIRTHHDTTEQTWFVTFTNYDWIPLFEMTNSYHRVYDWLRLINARYNIKTLGFVIMPNHTHFLFNLDNLEVDLNKIIANGKRFMAYDIVEKLTNTGNSGLLSRLSAGVSENERRKGQLHKVFESSFDAKPIYTLKFLHQKLDYIHHNPVSGKWSLCTEFTDYAHSSAAFYELGLVHPHIEITSYCDYWYGSV